jgi:hypothetical protein
MSIKFKMTAPLTQFQKSVMPRNEHYGWCHTDRKGKNPKEIRENSNGKPSRSDFFLNLQESDITKHFFDIFGLPFPNKDSIYRGNSQDLLFLDSYGLVIRTGPLDVTDLIHPGILQPLFWLPIEHTDHVIAIYPGIQLPNLQDKVSYPVFDNDRHKLKAFLEKTGQNTHDINTDENIGYCSAVPLVLDVENSFFGTSDLSKKQKKHTAFSTYVSAGIPYYKAIGQVMQEIYGGIPEYQHWIKAFEAHQVLRAQIYHALNQPNQTMRLEKLNLFYQRCQNVTQRPERVLTHEWSQTIRNRQKFWVKHEPQLSEVALYKPWTGCSKDNLCKNSMTPS